jgi:guanine nucleotide-binding protein G(i) subunit alpha
MLDTSMMMMMMMMHRNKRDIFQEKIKRVPLSKTFPDFDTKGGDEYTAATNYIKAKYEGKNKTSNRKHIYTHVTCATDTENVRAVFNAVKDIINKQVPYPSATIIIIIIV